MEFNSMQTYISKLAQAVVAVAMAGGVSSLPAAAATQYGYDHHRTAHRTYHRVDSSDVTVRKSPRREHVAAAPDAFHGPAAIITAPVEIAATFVSLPFRAVDVMFPARTNDPRVLIGAPVHFAGQIAEFPFYVINGAFGVRPTYYTYN
jgi:hypothetical protein